MLQMKEVIKGIQQDSNVLDIHIDSVTISTSRILKYFKNHYSMFRSVHSDTVSDFVEVFNDFLYDYDREIKRIYEVINAEYNPLFNVEGTEERITGTKQDKVSVSPSTATTHAYERSNDDSGLVETNKNTIDSVSEGTTTADNTLTDEGIEGSYNNIVHDKFMRKGNIGITKSTELLTSEIEVRMTTGFLKIVLSLFARQELIV